MVLFWLTLRRSGKITQNLIDYCVVHGIILWTKDETTIKVYYPQVSGIP